MQGLAKNILEAAVNRVLRLDPDTLQRLHQLQGKIIKITITDWQKDFYFMPGSEGIQLVTDFCAAADTAISGDAASLLKIACEQASGPSLFKNKIKIEGDVELGQEFRHILQNIDLDWEEYLSQYMGDVVSHEISWRAKRALDFGKKSLRTLGAQLRDYFHFEGQYLPRRQELELFYHDVATIRDDVERFALRLQRVEQKIQGEKI